MINPIKPPVRHVSAAPSVKWGAAGASFAYASSMLMILAGPTFFAGVFACASVSCFVKVLPPGTRTFFNFLKKSDGS